MIPSLKKLEVILNNIADGVTVQDLSGKLVYANNEAARMMGFKTSQELLDTPVGEVLSRYEMTDENGDPFPPNKLPGRQAMRGRKGKVIVAFKLTGTDKVRWSTIHSSPVYGESGNLEYAVNVMHDITEQKTADQHKDVFLGMASHELKTPLASMKALTQLTRRKLEKEGNAKAVEYLVKIETKVDDMTKLINDLRDLAKINSGQLEYEMEVLNLKELMTDIVDDFRRLVKTHTIVLEGTYDTLMIADRVRIRQVISNLLKNAIKYSPDADKVLVRCDVRSGNVILAVHDFGIGIPDENKENIFRPFYRGGNAGVARGLGIGLYIACEIIRHHGGDLTVTDNKGKGSIFTVTVPIKPLTP